MALQADAIAARPARHESIHWTANDDPPRGGA
jgi:hypothetical protein